MKIIATGFGESDVLKAVPSEPRPPGRGEVTIQAHAAGVNHVDLKVYHDQSYKTSHGQKPPAFPLSRQRFVCEEMFAPELLDT